MLKIDPQCKPYFDEVVAKAKELGLYEPVKPHPKPDDRWHREDEAGNVAMCKVSEVIVCLHGTTPLDAHPLDIVLYHTYEHGSDGKPMGWSQDRAAMSMPVFKRVWTPRSWDPTDGGKLQFLKTKLDWLATYGGTEDACEVPLYKDSAPLSFGFDIYRLEEKDGAKGRKHWFTGGLLFHGKPDQSGAVSMNTTVGWEIHT